MRIKSIKKKKKIKNYLLNYFLISYFLISITFIFLFVILFFNTGYWSNYKDQFLNRLYTSSVNNYIYLPKIYSKKLKAKFYKIPELNLNISFKNQINLENQRVKALKTFATGDDTTIFEEVSGSLNINKKEYKANIRFKGDRKSHWFDKDQASYKIYLKGDKKIFGMEKFSLQKPRVRNYIHEWLYFEFLGELDLIKLNYKFINLSINGANSQLYALEESFDKIVVERNKKRNGPIFSLHEEFSLEVEKTKFEIYNKKYWLNDENVKFTQIVRKKLENFYKNKDQSIDIFDQEKWAKFFAVTDLNYYAHGRAAKSVKYFYNPVSAYFEPIGYDGHRAVPNFNKYIKSWFNFTVQNSFEDALNCKKNLQVCAESAGRVNGNYLVYRFFFNKQGNLNEEFYQKYRSQVIKLSSEKFLDDFFLKRKKQIDKINSLIYDDYFFVDNNYFYGPGIYYFSEEDIYNRAKHLKIYFKQNPEKIYVEQENNKLVINNVLNNNLGLNIIDINCKDTSNFINYIFPINQKIKTNFTTIKLSNFANNLKLKCLNINFSNNQNYIFTKTISQNIDSNIYKNTKIREDLYLKYFQIRGTNLFLKNSNVVIDQNIIIPKNYTVFILPGEKIIFKNNSFIYSNSAWNVNGNEKKIIIKGLEDNLGGGILITDNKKKSFFNNVEFSYLSGPNNKMNSYLDPFFEKKKNVDKKKKIKIDNDLDSLNHILYGAINFSNTDVLIKNVYFKKICSEDALNIISSNFLIENSKFEDNCSDGIDVDFGIGMILDSKFKNIGNDAIDFSGSNVELKDILIENVGDKLVSIGEKSNIKITKLIGKNSNIGIATKDGSLSTLQHIKLINMKIGLASYIKKAEYKPGKIIANKIYIDKSLEDWLTDEKSHIIMDNKKLNSSTKNLVKIIYGE